MSQKNKRNTRRGRLKRWFPTPTHGFTSRGWVCVSWRFAFIVPQHGKWYVIRARASDDIQFPSRAAAMRAAEHLARRR